MFLPFARATNGCGCQNRFGIPCWLVGDFTHVRTYFSGDWDVHWGYNLDLTHGQLGAAWADQFNSSF